MTDASAADLAADAAPAAVLAADTAADAALLERLERFYDAVPRQGGRAERVGPLELFVREGAGWPYYARPALGAGPVALADVARVRERQRELGVPEQLEWVHDLAPSLTEAVRAGGLDVHLCPLLVLAGEPVEVPLPAGLTAEVLTGDEDDLAVAEAVASVGFGAQIGTRVGEAGPAERDAAAGSADSARTESLRARIRSGEQVRAVVRGPEGPLCVGGFQHAEGVAELVGVATLPSARRQGLAAALTALLAGEARRRGLDTVFLSAQDEDVARVYARVGFRRVGTAGIAEPPG